MDDVRRGLTFVAGVFLGSTQVTITASALNTDSFLNPGGTPTPMLQAWGANFGKPISLQGMQARSSKSIFLSVGTLNANNQANVKVLNHLGSHICFTAANGAAFMDDFTTLPLTICPGGPTAQMSGSPPSNPPPVTIQNGYMNAMAQMTDAQLYTSKVAGFHVSQAEALTGFVPDLLGALNGDRAFTPCWSFSWANDVSVFMAALGAVAADHLNEYVVQKVEIGAKALAKAIKAEATQVATVLATLETAATQLAGTSLAPLANAARDAVASVATQIPNATTQATLLAQDAGDLVGAVGTAARLTTSASSRANAAQNAVQAAIGPVTTQAPSANAAVQAAASAAATAESSIQALASALDPSSSLSSAIATAEGYAHQVTTSLVNLAGIAGQALADAERIQADTAGALIGFAVGSTLGQVLEMFATADILFTAHNDDHNFNDRGIATHEYGHFVLCNLLDSVDAVQFAAAYDEAAAAGFVTGQAPSATGSVMNESFADFIASQVMGATSYALPPNSFRSPNMNYCPAATTAGTANCIETNTTNTGPSFDDKVLRAVSLYTDAFDGHVLVPPADVPTNGDEWAAASGGGITLAAAPGISANDETVALTGAAFRSWISNALSRGTLLREDNVFGGLSDAMIKQQYTWCQRCEVFYLHTVDASGTNNCPEQWVGPRPTFTLNGTTTSLSCRFENNGVCPAGTTPDELYRSCDPTCPAGKVFDPPSLTCVGQIIP